MEPDGDTLEQAIRGHHQAGAHGQALEVALRGYGDELMGFLFNRMRDEAAAAEVFSEVGEDLWRGLPAFSWRSSFRTWMYIVARNAAERHRRCQDRRAREVGLSAVSQLIARQRTTTLVHLRSSARNQLDNLRAELAPDEQELLLLRIKHNLSWKEIALIGEGAEAMDDEALARLAARYRQRFQALKKRLKKRAQASGLLPT